MSVPSPSLLFALLFAAGAAAAPAPDPDPALDGVITDQTRTPAGHMLYRAFLRAWQLNGAHPEANLTLQEQPSPRGGTTITVEHQRRVLFRAAASGARAEPERVAAAAVESVVSQLNRAELPLHRDLDSRDELK